jgi:hypothetical protein
MKGKWTPHIIAVMAFVVFIVLGLACASTDESVQNEDDRLNTNDIQIVYDEIPFSKQIEKATEPSHGLIVEAFIGQYDPQYVLLCDAPILNPYNSPSNTISIRKNFIWFRDNHGSIDLYTNDLVPLFDKNTKYKVYIRERSVEKIEGLLSPEQANALQSQKKAEEKAADEKANRYDASKFTIVPPNFRPTAYTSIDLFKAVSDVEKMKSSLELYGKTGLVNEWYVSDVIFVNQNGTDIRFRTSDNAITQSMKVDGRSGLTSGQRVRLYYTVTKDLIAEWRVVAIERL